MAIVTGAGGGLGRAHAIELARHRACVVVNDIGAGAERVAAETVAAGGDAVAATALVTDEAQVAAVMPTAMSQWNRVDILVNNASFLKDRSFAKMTVDDFRDVWTCT